MNVINHGFSDGREHEVAARLIYDEGKFCVQAEG